MNTISKQSPWSPWDLPPILISIWRALKHYWKKKQNFWNVSNMFFKKKHLFFSFELKFSYQVRKIRTPTTEIFFQISGLTMNKLNIFGTFFIIAVIFSCLQIIAHQQPTFTLPLNVFWFQKAEVIHILLITIHKFV